MESRTVGLSASRLVLALSLAFVGAGVWAQDSKTEDHTAHHPADAASAPKPAPKAAAPKAAAPKPAEPQSAAKPASAKVPPAAMDKGAVEKMGQMDAKMKIMQEMHEKFMAAKTPEERMALMPEHMKTLQEAMSMMDGMRGGGMGMGDKGGMMGKMPMDMMGKHQMMEKRMDMMQSMMQMMMDRMQMPATR
ncbi:hypothetical protein [Hydrogenophaga pseudoflava]|uniref:hypothetical protein n=1 Tax=Hydrogenophaga pseudoflava TaxID=47421 RepID=UPI0027E5300D|nr:hypothetical protein [Hydrogenophaga pseudoflava]MDQ7746594.1 hypothetical protein [Hydrogenophaga pseudoflava]